MCFLDTDQQEAALNHIGEYFNAHPRDDHAISFTMSRLWALAAVEEKNERPACITRLRQDLAAPALRQDRMASVRQLVRLLRLEDMQSEIRPLLEGELSHPAHSQDQEALAALKDMLRSETEGAAVTRTVQRWLERHAPPWFDAVQPLSLADAGLNDEDADLDEEADNLPPVPRCKLWLLAAQETSLDAEDRVRWFANALSLWPRLNALTRDQFHAGVSTLLDDPQAPADLKDRALRVTAIVCADHDEKETWLRFSKKHDDLILDEYTRDVLNVVDLVLKPAPPLPPALPPPREPSRPSSKKKTPTCSNSSSNGSPTGHSGMAGPMPRRPSPTRSPPRANRPVSTPPSCRPCASALSKNSPPSNASSPCMRRWPASSSKNLPASN